MIVSTTLFLFGLLVASPSLVPAQELHPVLLVVNQGDHDVSFTDPRLNSQATRPAPTLDVEGVTGHEVAVSPDGRIAFIPIYSDVGVGKPGTNGQTVKVIDLATHQIVRTVDFGHGVRPHCAIFDPTRGLLYVTTELDKTISIIDPHTLKVIGSIPTGQEQSHMFALAHNGRFGYTANVVPGTVSVLDMNTRRLVTIIPISSNTQRISLTPDDRRAFTADQTRPRLAVISTAINRVTGWIPLPAVAYGTAPTPDGRWLLASMRGPEQVAVIDLQTLQVVRTIDVPGKPTEILVRPDGKVAYVSCGRRVAAVNLENWTVAKTIDAGDGADGLAWVP